MLEGNMLFFSASLRLFACTKRNTTDLVYFQDYYKSRRFGCCSWCCLEPVQDELGPSMVASSSTSRQ